MMEENRKRAGVLCAEDGEEFAGKRPCFPVNTEEESKIDEEDELLAWLRMDDDGAVSDLSKLLETEIPGPPPFKVSFSGDPYSAPVIFQSSSAYVTINGNNDESCGSSFSESESSVMASIDLCGYGLQPGRECTWERSMFQAVDGGAWVCTVAEEARGLSEKNGEGWLDKGSSSGVSDLCDPCDDEYDYDAMLARFLGEDFMESHQMNDLLQN